MNHFRRQNSDAWRMLQRRQKSRDSTKDKRVVLHAKENLLHLLATVGILMRVNTSKMLLEMILPPPVPVEHRLYSMTIY
jgi:hypothetical protein